MGWVTNRNFIALSDRKIIDTIPNEKKPQVTFSCKRGGPSGNMTMDSTSGGYRHPLFAPFNGELGSDAADSDDVDGTCSFQFWVDSIESFYCKLDGCGWEGRGSASKSTKSSLFANYCLNTLIHVLDTNRTNYQCKTIECACVADRFLCGEDGSVSE